MLTKNCAFAEFYNPFTVEKKLAELVDVAVRHVQPLNVGAEFRRNGILLLE